MLLRVWGLTCSQVQPTFLFCIDEIKEALDSVTIADGKVHWIPSTDEGAHERVAGGVSGLWWYCNAQNLIQYASIPNGCRHYKTFSVYYSSGFGFWVMRGDATNPGEGENWHRLNFEHDENNWSSYLTNAGDQNALYFQRDDQMWPHLLLPDIYHADHRGSFANYGGLKGDLPIFLALMAFSTSADWLPNVLPRSFIQGRWMVHQYQRPSITPFSTLVVKDLHC
jgi:hypothetical protein